MKPRDSLAPRIVFSLIALLTLASGLLISASVWFERRIYLDALRTRAAGTADYAANTLAYPVWNLIYREMDVQLSLTFRDEAVHGAVLKMDDFPGTVVAFSRDGNDNVARSYPVLRDNWFSERRDVVFEGNKVASLELFFSRDTVFRRLLSETVNLGLIILMMDTMLGLLLFGILRAYVFRPLASIERWASSLGTAPDRLPLPDGLGGGRGEIASLRGSITAMVGLLDERYATIESRERDYRSLLESSPVSIWELDFSAVREAMGGGFRTEDPEEMRRLLRLVRVTRVNQNTLALLGVSSLEELHGSPWALLRGDAFQLFVEEIRALGSGARGIVGECRIRLPSGERRAFSVRFAVFSGYEGDWSRVVLTASDITDRVRAERRLVSALAQKDALVRELFHRTRNSLQLISSIMSLRDARAADSVRAELRSLRGRIDTISLAQEKLYESRDLSSLDLASFLTDLLGAAMRDHSDSSARVRATADFVERDALIDVAVPLGLILYELVDNALRHAFPGGRSGEVRVGLRNVRGEEMELWVEDDGVGPPPGFDPRSGGGIGIDTIMALGEGQLKGRLRFEVASGFRCSLLFSPASENKRRV